MARFKTHSRSYLDERAFPIRVLTADPGNDLLLIRFQEAQAWLNDNVGRGQWAMHGGGNLKLHVRAFYFRTTSAVDRFLVAHPAIKLSDNTDLVDHLEAERNPQPRYFGRQDGAHLVRDFKG